ncbi:MAG: GspE/PulE family protein [bacterium]|nr:GspE/PulE family protein [bacterium]
MRLPDKLIKEIVEESKYVDKDKLAAAALSSFELRKPLSETLVFKGLLSDEILGKLVAEHFKVPYYSLQKKRVSEEMLALLPETTARNFRVIPLELTKNRLKLGMEDPRNLEAIEFVKRKTGYSIEPTLVTSDELNVALGSYKKNINEEFSEIIKNNADRTSHTKLEDIEKAAIDVPVVKVLDTLLEYAAAEGASDVHIEHGEDESIVRFRVDGFLKDVITLNKDLHPPVVARIKILSGLKIDEHRVPQDGRFKFKSDDEIISLRVSILPSFYGENIVMRILRESARPLSLEELGLTGSSLALLKQNIQRSHGLILVTGPTGSGKTTTLYSVLNMLNTIKVKICTVEDPVEYAIKRVSQVHVNTKTGLTFASGLRALLRHDPNIIMVGEIRDGETVDMAIHSALTGHLVLSSLHTNSAAGAIPRLIDMGAEPFLVASTLSLVIAQRLVRGICPSCVEKTKVSPEMLKFIEKLAGEDISKQEFYKGKGCPECGGSGYKGRVGIYEALELDADLRTLIRGKVSAKEIEDKAKEKGMTSLFMGGLDQVAAGVTTIEEVLRVMRE